MSSLPWGHIYRAHAQPVSLPHASHQPVAVPSHRPHLFGLSIPGGSAVRGSAVCTSSLEASESYLLNRERKGSASTSSDFRSNSFLHSFKLEILFKSLLGCKSLPHLFFFFNFNLSIKDPDCLAHSFHVVGGPPRMKRSQHAQPASVCTCNEHLCAQAQLCGRMT